MSEKKYFRTHLRKEEERVIRIYYRDKQIPWNQPKMKEKLSRNNLWMVRTSQKHLPGRLFVLRFV
jgi:hypothetical protein